MASAKRPLIARLNVRFFGTDKAMPEGVALSGFAGDKVWTLLAYRAVETDQLSRRMAGGQGATAAVSGRSSLAGDAGHAPGGRWSPGPRPILFVERDDLVRVYAMFQGMGPSPYAQ